MKTKKGKSKSGFTLSMLVCGFANALAKGWLARA
jgi:hypothetical protein